MGLVRKINGLVVTDAKRPLSLKITKPDIARAAGSTKNPAQCAAARACYRELHAKEVRIHLARAYIRLNDYDWVRYKVPNSLRAEIVAFDRGGEFEPGTFRLVPVPPKEKLGVPARSHTKTVTGKKRKKFHHLKNVRAGPATQS